MTLDQLLSIRENLTDALDKVDNEIVKNDWRHLANRGQKILAIKTYYRKHNSTLTEAKSTVEAFIEMIKAQ